MAIRKTLNHQTDARLLLESGDPVKLPPAEIDESRIVAQFETYKPHLPELVAALRAGTLAEPVPVMTDGSTFAIHGETRTFWVKLWHAGADRARIERAQVVSCIPSTRGVRIVAPVEDQDYDDEFDDEEDSIEEARDADDRNAAG